MSETPHDHLARKIFGRPAEARSLIQAFLPEEQIAILDLQTLRREPRTFVEPRLRERLSDLLFSVETRGKDRKRTALVYFLFEHKSHQDRWLALQLFVYIARIWSTWREEHGDGSRLPLILPIVLYHGDRPWDRPLELVDLCDAEGRIRDVLGPAQPRVPLTLIDLCRTSEGRILERLANGTASCALTLLVMKSIRSNDILERLTAWTEIIRRARHETGGRQLLETLLCYLYVAPREEIDAARLQEVLTRSIGSEAEELVMNTGEKLIEKGRIEGKIEERREALAAVLRTRLGEIPDAARSKMATADLKSLQRWHERALTAASLEEVFAPG
ncbi:MAG: Rpn family recombination-promoting nuclease/putative transposase [Planctomycetota bacterium]